jgi:hypothetical protein
MTTSPRLFARIREQHKDPRQLSSENFIIVLLDVYSDDAPLRKELCRLPNCHYFRATSIENCLGLILQEDAKDALIMLIISNRFVDFIHHHVLEIVPQLSHVYLFDRVFQNQQFSSDQRFRGVFHCIQSLLEKIRDDIEEVRKPRNVAGGIQYVLQESAQFFWYRFFFNVLDRLQHTEIAKCELISRLRDKEHENKLRDIDKFEHENKLRDIDKFEHENKLRDIDKFEHENKLRDVDKFKHEYRPEDVILWYTRENFFYRFMNKALRENDINEIFLWRTYIQDLDRSLQQLRLEQMNLTQISFFRGQGLHINVLNKLKENLGQLVTMTSFWSTTAHREIAMMFAESNNQNPEILGVFWSLNVDSNDTRAIFADIRELSAFYNEEECLFSLRSMFRINRIEFVDNLWQVDLTAVDEDNQEFCTAINPWKATIGEQSFFSGRHEPLFTRYLNLENGSFLAFQLLIDIMLRLNQTDYAREEMIEMCRLKYANHPVDLKKIDEFEQTYSHQDAAKWYTTDSFLYRLLNDSLRLEDIDTLFKLRYYIYDLHNQLAQLQIPYIQSFPINEPILTLYRGQRIKITELKKLRENIGKLISKNSFLSTTNDVQAAVFFSGDGSLDNAETDVSVLYQITIDTRVPHSIPFGRIQYESIFEDEDEVLFSIASVFRIDTVEQYGNLWVVDLTLINKEDEEWNALTAHL